MLANYLTKLENTIMCAQSYPDVDVFKLAAQRMDELMDHVATLPMDECFRVEKKLDQLLPSDWVYWMEICRHQGEASVAGSQLIH